MRQSWSEEELAEHWSLLPDERRLLGKKINKNRLIFAMMLKFFQYTGRFPEDLATFPKIIINNLAKQLKLTVDDSANNSVLDEQLVRKYKLIIRKFLNFKAADSNDVEQIQRWLVTDILPQEDVPHAIEAFVYERFRELKIVPNKSQVEQCINNALLVFEQKLFSQVVEQLSDGTKQSIDDLITTPKHSRKSDPNLTKISLNYLKHDPRQATLETVLNELAKLRRIQQLELPQNIFQNLSPKILQKYRLRIMMETPKQIYNHATNVRYTIIAAFCHLREQAIIDGLVDLLIQITHKIAARAERRVVKELLRDLRKVSGKTGLLYSLAEAAVDCPDGIISEVLYPVVGEQTLKDLVREFKSTGLAYQQQIHTTMRSSYSNHYRRMLAPIINTLNFRANNEDQNPVMNALNLLRKYSASKLIYYPAEEIVPTEKIVRENLYDIVIEETDNNQLKINRINYEMAVLQTLKDKLRCKEIWVDGAYRYRNPDEDLPTDFDDKRNEYYQLLKQPLLVEEFIARIQKALQEALTLLNASMPKNSKVKIITKNKKGWISVSPLKAQLEPVNITKLKSEIIEQWPMTSLLDVLKEVDIRIGITSHFKSAANREILQKDTLQKRLLLCLFGIGTNTGLKRISSGNPGTSYEDLRYVRRRFIQKESLRQVLAKVANAIFAARDPAIWGEATVACASDSKKFGSWDQNLMTEWHVRYGGRGIMIYWHVEKGSVCIYSQLKSCSSSEVGAMIEGVLKHCTDMKIEKNYVDSHGQSEVAFAFSYILNFDLLPRLADIGSQKLYRCYDGDEYKTLQLVLARPIKWDLIRIQYDQIMRYVAALRLGKTDSEAILRRFTRHNRQHPTYQALTELGKVVKTIFLCRYLQSEALRQEIHEGLNTVERWNGVNGFIFYGKGGDIATNSRDDQEISMLCLHLLQICLVYINTLMIQHILANAHWQNCLTREDKRALTPLIHVHINPYGLFLLDMRKRLSIGPIEVKARSYA
jgi:TnpA family transposase